jgi:hypothetical protein
MESFSFIKDMMVGGVHCIIEKETVWNPRFCSDFRFCAGQERKIAGPVRWGGGSAGCRIWSGRQREAPAQQASGGLDIIW